MKQYLFAFLLLFAFVVSGCSRGGGGNAFFGPVYLERSATVDAGAGTIVFPPVHRGHYDLSPVTLSYLGDPAFAPLVMQVPVKSWCISVGRWEIGPAAFLAPEAACYSTDVNQLKTCSREFYTGPNDLVSAQTLSNYHFSYIDSAIDAVIQAGAQPYLDFDYMPLSLASNTNPNTANNLYLTDQYLSFSNGIRTSPPLNNAVYAEVVKQVVDHVMTKYAGSLTLPLQVEIGNEPDLVDLSGAPSKYFWTGTRAQFLAMYQACAAALDTKFGSTIKIGAGSFAWSPPEPGPTFAQDFLAGLGTTRLDFLSFHIYDDTPETYFVNRLFAIKALRDALKPSAELHCTEWGMALTGGPKFDDMRAALHHAKALEYFLLFDVKLSHRALIRDVVAASGQMGLLKAGPPVTNKPAAYTFQAYEMLAETPTGLNITSINPPAKPMLVAGASATAITVLFFHERPPAGEVGRMALTIKNVPFANYRVDRYELTDATVAGGNGLELERSQDESGSTFSETLTFSDNTVAVWRLTQK
jgi:hypothetical protein